MEGSHEVSHEVDDSISLPAATPARKEEDSYLSDRAGFDRHLLLALRARPRRLAALSAPGMRQRRLQAESRPDARSLSPLQRSVECAEPWALIAPIPREPTVLVP